MRSPFTAIALLALASSFASAQNGALTFSPSPLVICTEPGQGVSEVPISISTSSGTVQFTSANVTSDGGWLTVTPTSGNITTTSRVLFFAAVKGGTVTLPVGSYNGQVVLSGSGGVLGKLDASLIVSSTPCANSGSGVITASPGALAFQLPPGTAFTGQTVLLHNNFPGALAAGIDASTTTGQDWLSVFSSLYMVSHVSTPLFVSVSSAGLQDGQTYFGNISLTASNGATLNIPVTMTLTPTATKIDPLASPASLNFSLPLSSPGITQKIQITNPGSSPINILTGTGVFNGVNWLSVSPVAELIPANSTVTLTAAITTGGLVSGINGGSIGVSVASGSGGSVSIPVTVNYGASAGAPLTVAPTQLSFTSQTGSALPASQNLSLTSTAAAPFSAQVSTSSGGNWLTAAPLTGSTPATIKVQVNPSGLTARSYSGQILITNTNTGEQQAIPVSFQVSDLPILVPGNSGTTFTARAGSLIIPAHQSVSLASSAADFAFTASVTPVSGGAFLFVTPTSGTTPQSLTLTLNPSVVSQLAANTYVANVTLTAAGAGNSPVIYPVTLTVTGNTLLNPSQTSVNFNYQTGQAQPAAQFVNIGSTDASLHYAATVSTANCSGFLSASALSGSTPDVLSISVNTAGLPAGTCNGTVSLTSATAGNSPLNIPVTLNIGNTPALNASPGALQVTAQVGTNAAAQSILLSSTDGNTPLSFTAAAVADTSQGWLSATPASGNTPNSINVTFNTGGLAAGTYLGRIVIGAPGGKTVTVPVSVLMTAEATVAANSSSLTFAQASQGAPPASQTLQVISTVPGTAFTATAAASNGGNWLTATSPSGVTPGVVTVSVNGATLTPGTYTGIVTIRGGNTINILVTLTVGPASILSLSTAALTFNYQVGSPLPQTQSIQVNSSGGFIPFTAATPANFLTLTPASGVTPGTVTVGLSSAALAGMTPGQYSGIVTIASANAPGGSQQVNVTLNIAPAPAGSVVAVVNAASLKLGPVAPGELVTFFGSALGPQEGAYFTLTPQGAVPTSLANITVSFDGNLAPLTFVNATQINAIVPYEMAGRAGANVIVSRAGVASAPFAVKITDTTPAIFSLNQSGNGPGAIRNQNNSINGTDNPAAAGSVIQIFGTGEGLCQGVRTGSVTPTLPPFPKPVGTVSVTIGGKPAVLQYAGEAPGSIAGLLQVNAIVPDGLGSGPQTVVLKVGDNSNDSQTIVVTLQ
ncbi:MAG: hypothetical protein M3O35_01270 [Acidobacteriota bacterium]|nr:hypothetical protein [Acidobacteriota bacterium]